jgi:TolB-like protein
MQGHALALVVEAAQSRPRSLAVMPFEGKGLTADEVHALDQKVREELHQTGLFSVMREGEMNAILQEAQFTNLAECNYSYCLTQVGKILGVTHVLHGVVTRQGKLYTLHVRLLDVATEDYVRHERYEHSGDFEGLLAEGIPLVAQRFAVQPAEGFKISQWHLFGAAVIAMAIGAYFVHRALVGGGVTGEDVNPPTKN